MSKADVVLDKKTLVEIYERHSPEIFRYAYRMLDDKNLAEDCVADTFLRLLIAVRGGILPDNIRAYLFRISHNWIIDYYRRRPPQTFLQENVQGDPEANPPHLLAGESDRQRVRSALLQLPAEQRQVIELRFIENWPHREVAVAVGKTVEATRALQHRAVEALRQLLAE
jgi:RNA polymerase sigma-70 factor (ECF subfamily)